MWIRDWVERKTACMHELFLRNTGITTTATALHLLTAVLRNPSNINPLFLFPHLLQSHPYLIWSDHCKNRWVPSSKRLSKCMQTLRPGNVFKPIHDIIDWENVHTPILFKSSFVSLQKLWRKQHLILFLKVSPLKRQGKHLAKYIWIHN